METLQVGAGLAMTTVLTTYPAGWGAASVAAVCGDSASYRLGSCGLRWSYGLAVAATADCFLLGLLALSLAAKQRLALAEAEAGFCKAVEPRLSQGLAAEGSP